MNMERRCILLIAPIALGLANWLPNQVAAADFGEAQVTQVVQDVKVVPAGAASRPAAVNETVTKVNAGQMIVYDPIAMRLENPVEVNLQEELNSPLVTGFRPLPSSGLINETIESQRAVVAPNSDLDRAVRAAGAANIATATPDQFMQGFNSVLVSYPPSQVRTLVAGAIRARPGLANQITAAAA